MSRLARWLEDPKIDLSFLTPGQRYTAALTAGLAILVVAIGVPHGGEPRPAATTGQIARAEVAPPTTVAASASTIADQAPTPLPPVTTSTPTTPPDSSAPVTPDIPAAAASGPPAAPPGTMPLRDNPSTTTTTTTAPCAARGLPGPLGTVACP